MVVVIFKFLSTVGSRFYKWKFSIFSIIKFFVLVCFCVYFFCPLTTQNHSLTVAPTVSKNNPNSLNQIPIYFSLNSYIISTICTTHSNITNINTSIFTQTVKSSIYISSLSTHKNSISTHKKCNLKIQISNFQTKRSQICWNSSNKRLFIVRKH
jgi:hypothetical protein